MDFQIGLILQIALFAVLIVSAYTDITRNKVYNWCTLPAIAAGLGLSYVAGGVADSHPLNLANSVLGLCAGGGIFFLASLWGGIGFGDVKLMAAVGALTGFKFTLHSLFYSTLVGFAFAIVLLIWQERFLSGVKSSFRYAFTLRGRKEMMERSKAEAAAAGALQPVQETLPAAQAGPPEKTLRNTIPYGAAIAIGTFWAWFLQSGIVNLGL